jgi:N-acetyl-alpha-D-glucosaminyl L-malate synthase BshA
MSIFDRVRRRHDVRLLLAGDGPERSLAERMAREGGYEDRCVFLGNVAAIETVLPVARVLLLPSDPESFGLVALEAMSCGVPVVGSAAGGLPEVVLEGETGFLRPVGDVDAMAEAASQLIQDSALHRRLAEASRRRAAEVYPTPKVVAQYRELYEKTLKT